MEPLSGHVIFFFLVRALVLLLLTKYLILAHNVLKIREQNKLIVLLNSVKGAHEILKACTQCP